jgi:hypothetical protein
LAQSQSIRLVPESRLHDFKLLFPRRGRTFRVGLEAKQISLRQDLPNTAGELADVCSAIDNGIELNRPSKTGQTKLVEVFTHSR